MRLVLQPEPCERPFDHSPKNVEHQAMNAIIASLDVFQSTPIRVGENAVYFWYAGQVFELAVSIKMIRKLGEWEEVPVDFVQKRGEVEDRRQPWWRRIINLFKKGR
jgi:hypothetical protein